MRTFKLDIVVEVFVWNVIPPKMNDAAEDRIKSNLNSSHLRENDRKARDGGLLIGLGLGRGRPDKLANRRLGNNHRQLHQEA